MKKMKLLKSFLALTIVSAVFAFSTINAYACTGFYMGKDTTENGTSIWGRSEDISATYRKIYYVHPAETHEDGELYQSSTGFSCPYPAQTLRYAVVPDSYHNQKITPEPYGEVGMNEKNVAISATNTLSSFISGSTLSTIDPMVSSRNGGLAETDMATVVLMQATSARHAIEIIADLIDTYGAAGREGVMVSDPNEVWYMQIVSGHQYVAEKAPDDKIGFSPNMTMSGYINVNDTENVIASPGLLSVAEEAGTLVTNDNGYIHVAQSYANQGAVSNRLWQGYYYLKGQEAADALTTGHFEYFTDPREEKYTLFEAMRLLAYRGEGTDKYAGNETRNNAGIGNDNTVEAHVFETRYDMPEALATVQWLTMGPAEFSVYLPSYSNLITETYERYWVVDSEAFDADQMYWVFRQLYTLSKSDRENYGTNVMAFWDTYQQTLIEQQKDIDEWMAEIYAYSPELAEEKATALSKHAAEEAYTYARSMMEELQQFINNEEEGVFVPSVLEAGVQPTYTVEAIEGEYNYKILDYTIAYAQKAKADGALEGLVPSVATKFETALSNALAVRENPIAQLQIDDAAEALLEAIHYLDFKQADTSELEKLIETAEKYENETLYTPATYASFATALRGARTLVSEDLLLIDEDLDAINAAWNTLMQAILDLRLIPNKSGLQKLVNTANATDLSLYTVESGAVLVQATKAAQAVLDNENADEDDVKGAKSGLTKAIVSLQAIKAPAGDDDDASNETEESSSEKAEASKSGVSEVKTPTTNPKTGDNTPLSSAIVLVLISGLGIVCLKKKVR